MERKKNILKWVYVIVVQDPKVCLHLNIFKVKHPTQQYVLG